MASSAPTAPAELRHARPLLHRFVQHAQPHPRAKAISLSSPKSASCPTRLTPWLLFKESYRVAFGRGHRLASLAAIAPQALEGESLLGRRCCESTTRLRDLSC
jgi:hypothetical protein